MQPISQHSPFLAPLNGRWQFQRLEQVIYLASGEVAETIRQAPSESSYRFLDITDRELVYHHEQRIASKISAYKVSKEYSREGNTLFVVPYPNIKPLPQIITLLSETSLAISSTTKNEAHIPYTVLTMYFIRSNTEALA